MDARIKAWQEYLTSAPLGVGYGGPSDGVMNDQLKGALLSLESKLGKAGKPMGLLSGETITTDVNSVRSLIETVASTLTPAPVPAAPVSTKQQPVSAVIMWKKYLQGKGLYTGDVNSDQIDDAFKRGMQNLEGLITKTVPSVTGMIWQNGQINPQATIPDIEEALKLLANSKISSLGKGLEKSAVANFDALGPPDAADFIGTPFKQMFISQEDSKLDEYTPQGNQNQGKWQNPAPEEPKDGKEESQDAEEVIQEKTGPGIDQRMEQLVQLMNNIKK